MLVYVGLRLSTCYSEFIPAAYPNYQFSVRHVLYGLPQFRIISVHPIDYEILLGEFNKMSYKYASLSVIGSLHKVNRWDKSRKAVS